MSDKLYRVVLFIAALVIPTVCGGVVYALVTDAYGAFDHFGFLNFLTSSEWSYTEGAEQYGALPFITGTLMTTFLALLFCIPFSLPVALFVGEYFKGTKIAAVLSTITDLLACIPSIIYGLWGFYTLRPIIMEMEISPQGSGVLTASLVLAIMIIPYASSLSAEFIKMVPNDLKEGAYSLGATRSEVIRKVIFPVAGSGIFSAYVLAIGRALGETMTDITIKGDWKGTSLYVNGKLQERLEGRKKRVLNTKYNRLESMPMQETLVFPLQHIGDEINGFKGKVKNVKVSQE